MTRLDHNRAMAQLAARTGSAVNDITQDDHLGQPLRHAVPRHLPCRGQRQDAAELVDDQSWLENDFIPTVQQARRRDHRGPRLLVGRLGCHAADRPRARLGARHPEGDWVSMAVPSDGSYGVPEG